jgi:beta-glucanase (GH16 family)
MVKWFLKALAICLTFWGCSGTVEGQVSESIFYDDFNTNELNNLKWRSLNRQIGRTFLDQTILFEKEGNVNYSVFRHDTYSPINTGNVFWGSGIMSRTNFSLGLGKEFEARVRVRDEVPGLVDAFFTFGHKEVSQVVLIDELDFELLTTLSHNRLVCTTWDEYDEVVGDPFGLHFDSRIVTQNDFNRSQWNVLKIRWLPQLIEWYVNGALVRKHSRVLPNDPMGVFVNTWAAASSWVDAYDPNLQPTTDPVANQSYRFDVD